MKNISKKMAITVLIASIIMTTTVMATYVYWTKTLEHNIVIKGIDAGLLEPSYLGMKNKIDAVDLTVENQVALTIYAENFYEIYLNVTVTSDCEGLIVTVNGQYYEAWAEEVNDVYSLPNFEPAGDSFNIPLNTIYEVNKSKMVWLELPAIDEDGVCKGPTTDKSGCLVLTFNFDSELITTPCNCTTHLIFEMGT